MNRIVASCMLLALALLVGLATPALAAEAKGKIASVQADKNEFVLTDANNKNWTFHCVKDCKILIKDRPSKLADLQRGDEVTITYDREGDKLMATEVKCTRK